MERTTRVVPRSPAKPTEPSCVPGPARVCAARTLVRITTRPVSACVCAAGTLVRTAMHLAAARARASRSLVPTAMWLAAVALLVLTAAPIPGAAAQERLDLRLAAAAI